MAQQKKSATKNKPHQVDTQAKISRSLVTFSINFITSKQMVYYPGEEREVAKYCIKVTTNSSKYKAVYLTQKQAKKIENQKNYSNNPKLL